MSDPSSGRRFRGSLGVSSLVHLIAIALIVPVVATGTVDYGRIGDARKATESVTLATLTIEHRVRIIPHHAPLATRAAKVGRVPAVAAAPKSHARRRTTAVAAAPAHKAAKAGVWRSIIAHASHLRVPVAVLVATAAPERASSASAATQPPPAPSPSPRASATAVATTAASPAPEERRVAESGADVPFGGWGQSFEKPLVADDTALSALRAKFHGTAAIVVAVNEAGHATS
ncbi:MAG: hypothetical protein GIX03_11705, partial [Candidatus Eremiobacteraeota bacterium]|nr:hypothetical protein [Candidatus Eremiobacteraeota bacterium]